MADCAEGAYEFIAAHFYDCVYTWPQCIGFALGLTSICLWITAQMPQFLDNMRNQSAAALSVYFLVQWFLGDTLNLLGCLLNGQQLPTTTYLAMYFLLSDVVMLTQFLYYGALNKRREALARRAAAHRAARKKAAAGGGTGSGAASRTPSITRGSRALHYEETPGHMHHSATQHHQPQQAGGTPHWYQQPGQHPPAILSTAARVTAETSAGKQSDIVSIAMDWGTTGQEHSLASEGCTASSAPHDGPAAGSTGSTGENCSAHSSSHLGSQHAFLRGKAGRQAGAEAASREQGIPGEGCAGEAGEGDREERVVGGSEARASGSGGGNGMVAVVGAVSLLSLVALGVSVAWSPRAPPDPRPLLMPQLQHGQHHSYGDVPGSSRQAGSSSSSIWGGRSNSHVWLSQLLGGRSSSSGGHDGTDDGGDSGSSNDRGPACWWPCWWGPDFDWPHFLGSLFGYCSCCLYLTSRFSQIYKNWCRRSTEGLSKVMFVCTMSANLCTGFSILLRLQSSSALKEQLPWIGGAFGTVWLDAIIFWQATTYASLAGKAATPTPLGADSAIMSSPARTRRGTSARASPERDLL